VDVLLAGMSGGSKGIIGHYGNPTGNMALTPNRQPGTSWEGYGVDPTGYSQGDDQQGTDSLPYSLGLPATDLSGNGQTLSGTDESVDIDPALIGPSHVAIMARDLSSEAMLVDTSSADRHLDLDQFRMSQNQGLVDEAPVFSPLATHHPSPQADDPLGLLSDVIAHGSPRKALRALNAARLDIGDHPVALELAAAGGKSTARSWGNIRSRTMRSDSPDAEASQSDDEASGRQGSIETKDIMNAMNAILKLLHDKKATGKSTPRMDPESSPSKGLECPECKKVMLRSCELK
jgi:hypothetical protein